MSGHWWRAYDDAVDHPKLQRLPLPLFRAWFNLLCLASGNGGVLPPLGDIAFKLRMTEERVSAVLDELQRVRLLDEQRNGDGTYHLVPHNWHDRQFQSDTSTPRVKRFRERRRNVSAAVSETPPDTDSETDTETEKNPKANALGFANKKSRRAPAVAFPPDAVLSDEWLGYATGRGLTVPEAEAEFEKFSNHAQSTDRRCSDWTAAWRNWVIKAPEYRGPANVRNSRPSTSQIAFDLAEQARALERQAGIGRTDDVVGSD